MIQLADLLAFYPDISEDNFQTKISAKQEFYELSSDPKETLESPRGSYFKHQRWVQRFLRFYNKLLLFHETGTGKSCVITAIAELLKELHNRNLLSRESYSENKDSEIPVNLEGYIRKAIIVTSNQKLANQILEEIVCKCTRLGIYDTEEAGLSKRKIQNNVKKWYQIIPRESFAITLSKMSDDVIRRDYSDVVFFVDEAHKLRFTETKNKGNKRYDDAAINAIIDTLTTLKTSEVREIAQEYSDPKAPIDLSLNITELIVAIAESGIISNEELQRKVSSGVYAQRKKGKKKLAVYGSEFIYVQFWRLFHLIPQNKVVLATATTMLNSQQEIIPLMNLLLPVLKTPKSFENFRSYKDILKYVQVPLETNLDNLSSQELEAIFQGYVSYVKRLDTGVELDYQGIVLSSIKNLKETSELGLEDLQTKVFLEPMSDLQAEVYLEVYENTRKFLRFKEREISNFVYPDGSFGTQGLKRFVRKQNKKYYVQRKTKDQKKFYQIIHKNIDDQDGIRSLSVKFASIIKYILTHPKENVFVYSNLAEAGGSVPFGLCLEAQGYERFMELESVFRGVGALQNQYCGGGSSQEKQIRESFTKKPRYALFTSDTPLSTIDAMFELYNSYENRHGEYIQVFIASPVGGVGISLNNILAVHLLDSEWSPSSNYQAESRAIRVTSHQDLQRERPGEIIRVKIFNHAAYTCLPSKRRSSTKKKTCSKNNPMISVDVRIYIVAEEKDHRIKQRERFMKRIAIDCQSHFNRNKASPNALDYSKECDYDKCVRQCYDPEPSKRDFSTFEVYYIREPIKYLLNLLKKYLRSERSQGFLHAKNLIDLGKKNKGYEYLSEKYTDYLGLYLLIEPSTILNRFGIPSYLRKQGDVFLLSDIPITKMSLEYPSVCQILYNRQLVGHVKETLDTAVNNTIVRENVESVLNVLETLDPKSQEYEKYLYSISVDFLSAMLEEVLLIPSKERTSKQKAFLERMSLYQKPSKRLFPGVLPHISMWYKIPEPKNMMDLIQLRLDVKEGKIPGIKSRAGRPPLDGKYHPDFIEYDPREVVDYKVNRGEEAYDWGGGKEKVLFHILESAVSSDLNYKSTPTFNNISGKIRLYKPSESSGWRYANEIEQVAYSLWAQKQLYAFKRDYEAQNVYGILFPSENPHFIIRSVYKDPVGNKGGKRDRFRGQGCGTINLGNLLDIILVSEVPLPQEESERQQKIDEMDKETVLKEIASHKTKVLTENKSLETLKRLLFWLSLVKMQRKQRDYICSILQKHFRNTSAIFQTY